MDLERELRRQQELMKASYALHTTLDLDELLGLILDVASAGVDADRGTVFLVRPEGAEIWSRVLSGDKQLEIRLPLGQGIAGSVAQTGETIRLEDAYEDERFD
ncbi:MAG: GAF domain-containing protein, partial [Planctomycetota bacterium]|nr:GAF domain-containing protein [Planctomycetota bacterium]